MSSSPGTTPVLTVASNKGGVGKTTVSTNLAIYLRALYEDLPILIVSLDDQAVVDRMFALPGDPGPDAGNVKHAWAERSFDRFSRLGQYGVHFVPSATDTAPLKSRAEDPRTLGRIVDRTGWPGLVIFDTKSDHEALTRNALQVATRVLIPVADYASLEEAGKTLRLLDQLGRPGTGRLLLTLVDRRTRVGTAVALASRLRSEARQRGYPLSAVSLSRSPRVEALNSAGAAPRSILHHARGTSVYGELRKLADEVARDLGLAALRPAPGPARPLRPVPDRAAVSGLKAALLRGVGRD